jgi:hypothetical protein
MLNVILIEQKCLSSVFTMSSWIARFFIQLGETNSSFRLSHHLRRRFRAWRTELIAEINLLAAVHLSKSKL